MKIIDLRNTLRLATATGLLFTAVAVAPAIHAQEKASVVEEIIARVNNDVITTSDYQKADQQLRDEIQHDCQGCPADKTEAEYKDGSKDLLRGLIDQSLLVQRAKDMGISVETDLVKKLDQVRAQNNIATIDDLEKEVEKSGLAWEDYKTQIRNEVGQRINIGNDEVKKYYDAHQNEFTRPEQVVLSEIFLSTDGKSPEEIAAIQRKTEDLHARLDKGQDFSELAKRYSEGSTAKDQAGELGTFGKGELAPSLEEVVFKLDKGQYTGVIQTKTGFEILKVDAKYQAGLQPMDKVENEIMNKIYMERMTPAMRDYLAELREESYVMVKPGYIDSAAVPGASVITEVAPTPDTADKKKKDKKKVPFPKVNG
jgi:peptidyl-prolyl cis-trans isomerase SurA